MGKSNPKNSTTGKGLKRNNTDITLSHQSRKNKGLGDMDLDEAEVVEGNESKQKTNQCGVTKSVSKNINFDDNQPKPKRKKSVKGQKTLNESVKGESSQNVSVQEGHKSPNVRSTQIHYMEDGDEVVFEVDGQTTDFNSETKVEDQEADMASESEEEESRNLMGRESWNNNAMGCNHHERSSSSQETEEGIILPRNEATHKNEEEDGMQCFVDYIRKQGLVIVESSKLQKRHPKVQG